MNKILIASLGFTLACAANAANLAGVDKMLCAAGQAQICLETNECHAAVPWELDIPDFVVIDTKQKTVATTVASGLNRSTKFSRVERSDGDIYLQGLEGSRAFSFVIHEASGRMTVSVARDGISVTVFGACTGA